MDLYLPSDFRELHAAAPDDWRDAAPAREAHCEITGRTSPRSPDRDDPDPSWRVF